VLGHTIPGVRCWLGALRTTVVTIVAGGVLLVAADPTLAAPQGMDSNITWLKPPVPRPAPHDSVRGAPDRSAFTLVDLSEGATVHAWPGGPSIGWLDGATQLGYPSWVWALNTARGGRWARVLLPWRPNGRSGWVALAGRRVERTTWSVDVDLSRRRLLLLNRGTPVTQFEAGIGASASPTPTGRFFVTDLVVTGDPDGPFGWFALGLSGHQPNLPAGWGGGDQLAIHGTNQPSTIGAAASAGCVHVSARALSVLRAHLQLGSPVLIHA